MSFGFMNHIIVRRTCLPFGLTEKSVWKLNSETESPKIEEPKSKVQF